MFHEMIYTSHVQIPVSNMGKKRQVRASVVVNRLLRQLLDIKAYKCGYFVAVTKLISIGDVEARFLPHSVVFPVLYKCRTFMPVRGEIMSGVVHQVCNLGVFLKSGPMKMVYLSTRKMPNYSYIPGENVHVKEDMSRIEIGTVVRFVVYAVRWEQDLLVELRVLASIDGDGLGPVSLNGVDELDTTGFQEYLN